MTTSIGVSAGSGMVHCALVTSADDQSDTDTRVIDVDHTDGFDRAGRINAGIDLMVAQAKDLGHRVSGIGVAVRQPSDGRPVALRGYGPRRQVQVFSESEAIAKVLTDSGEVDRFESVTVADAGDSGVTTFALDPASGAVSGTARTTEASGVALDKAFTEAVQASDSRLRDLAGPGRDALVDACRTIKEDLAAGKEATISTGLDRDSVTVSPEVFDEAAKTVTAQVAAVVTAAAKEAGTRVIVLVGGLANVPHLKDAVQQDFSGEVIVPAAPETVAARGAAVLAQGSAVASRLTFIGGARGRGLLSLPPLALLGALLVAAWMAAYAVGSTNSDTDPGSSVATGSRTTAEQVAASQSGRTSAAVTITSTAVPTQQAPEPQYPETNTFTQPKTRPSWATTELPITTTQSTPQTDPSAPQSWPSIWPSWPLPSWPFPNSQPSKTSPSKSSSTRPSAPKPKQQSQPQFAPAPPVTSSTPVPSTPLVS